MNKKVMLAVVGFGLGATVLTLAATRHDAEVATTQVTPTAQPETEVAAAENKTVRTDEEPVATKIAAKAAPAKKAEPVSPPPEKPAVAVPQKQLDALLAPIALYPDQLLSQILMASTYPLEVIEAARWSARPENEGLKGDALVAALEDHDWDPSVKALAAFPQILKMMDSDLDWLAKLGDAFLAQQADVMDSVQRLRREARDADKLNSDARRQVTMEDNQISIAPANPDVVYVPFYNPSDAYGAWPYPDYPPAYIPPPVGYAYTPGIYYSYVSISPFWGWSSWDWRNRHIRIIDPPRYAHHNRGRWPVDNDVWKHDTSRGHGNRDNDGGYRDRPRQPAPGANPPINLTDQDFRRRQPPPAAPIAPRQRDFRREPAGLPDLSPPLPATAVLPAIAPPISNPAIGVQAPDQGGARDRGEGYRPRHDWQDQQQQQQDQAREDDARRMRQFQDRSITAPALSNVPPQQQQRMRDPSISAPPVTNVQPNVPPSAPPPMRAMPAPIMPQPVAAPQPVPLPQAPPQVAAPAPAPEQAAPSRFGNRGYQPDQPAPIGRQPGCGPYGCPRQ